MGPATPARARAADAAAGRCNSVPAQRWGQHRPPPPAAPLPRSRPPPCPSPGPRPRCLLPAATAARALRSRASCLTPGSRSCTAAGTRAAGACGRTPTAAAPWSPVGGGGRGWLGVWVGGVGGPVRMGGWMGGGHKAWNRGRGSRGGAARHRRLPPSPAAPSLPPPRPRACCFVASASSAAPHASLHDDAHAGLRSGPVERLHSRLLPERSWAGGHGGAMAWGAASAGRAPLQHTLLHPSPPAAAPLPHWWRPLSRQPSDTTSQGPQRGRPPCRPAPCPGTQGSPCSRRPLTRRCPP
jgi:hypothetical protein